jgi:hypothetical protein
VGGSACGPQFFAVRSGEGVLPTISIMLINTKLINAKLIDTGLVKIGEIVSFMNCPFGQS